MTEYTNNYGLEKPAFNTSTWHDAVNDNMDRIDALLALATAAPNLDGVWANATAYVVGNREFDSAMNRVYECLVNHTSAASGTFAADRTANPTYWALVDVGTVWRGVWVTATAYRVGDTAYNGGSTYRCALDHTSGVFATDLAASKWELYAAQGATGPGSGDVVGPAGATADDIVVFDSTTGKLVKDGGSKISDLAPKASPALTGTPTAPTAAANTNTTQIATTAYVQGELTDLLNGVSAPFDTLAELAAAISALGPASTTEALTGTDPAKAISADALAALWEKGADVASAATLTLGEGGFFHVTGSSGPITDIDFGTAKNGRAAWLYFESTPTIQHNATTLVLPGGANIVAAAGDRMLVAQDSNDNVIVLDYVRASGAPVIGTGQTLCVFGPADNEPVTSNYALFGVRNQHPYLAFDTTTGYSAVFSGILPRRYTGNGLTVYLHTMMASAITGTVGWTVAIERLDDSSQDLDSDSFASAQTITAATVPGTSGQTLIQSAAFTSGAQMDSLAAGEQFRLKITRDVANDTAAGDAQLVLVEVRETP